MYLSEAEQSRWLDLLKNKTQWCPDRTLLPITMSERGHLVIDAPIRRGLYVVINPDDLVVYVGKVDRTDGTVADRFRDHHAYDEEWHRAWVIALSPTLPPEEVLEWEHTLIQHFDPVGNKAGRAGRHSW